MSKANFKKKKNMSSTEKEIGIYYFCTDSKECLKRNKFYNEIRKNLMRKKFKKYFNNEAKK